MVATRWLIYAMFFLIVFSLFLFFVYSLMGGLMVLMDVDESKQVVMFKWILPSVCVFLSITYIVKKWSKIRNMVRELSP